MPTMQQLLFAQRFPFTRAAKRIVEEQSISLSELPESVVERAALLIEHAAAGEKYDLRFQNSDLLLQEVLAFPVAKILLSFMRDERMYERFAALFADAAFHYLNSAMNAKEEMIALASDLRLQFDFADAQGNLVSIPLLEFLQIRFSDPLLHLVNQSVSQGKVFLDLNGFARFLKAVVFERIIASLPVPVSGLPSNLEKVALRFKRTFREKERKQLQFAFKGKCNPNAFPPCMASLFEQLLSGKKLPHTARFYLASFLNRVAMPKEQIFEAFKKSPDFNEKIASYQINRIVKQNYVPPSCEKVRAQGYCPSPECRVRHPLTFYTRQLGESRSTQIAKK